VNFLHMAEHRSSPLRFSLAKLSKKVTVGLFNRLGGCQGKNLFFPFFKSRYHNEKSGQGKGRRRRPGSATKAGPCYGDAMAAVTKGNTFREVSTQIDEVLFEKNLLVLREGHLIPHRDLLTVT